MRVKYAIWALAFCSATSGVWAKDEPAGVSYVDGPFIGVKGDTQAEARDWAMCSATYDVAAELYAGSQPATSKQMTQRSYGAKLAVAMTITMGSVDDELTPESFSAAFNMGKLLMDTMPETATTALTADLERMGATGNGDQWMADFVATLGMCMNNLELQQAKVDLWRELVARGMLTLPEE
jgi:hypothetical protein